MRSGCIRQSMIYARHLTFKVNRFYQYIYLREVIDFEVKSDIGVKGVVNARVISTS